MITISISGFSSQMFITDTISVRRKLYANVHRSSIQKSMHTCYNPCGIIFVPSYKIAHYLGKIYTLGYLLRSLHILMIALILKNVSRCKTNIPKMEIPNSQREKPKLRIRISIQAGIIYEKFMI